MSVVELTENDNGARCQVAMGETVTVTLPETPTTGYRWQAEVDSAALRTLDDQSEQQAMPRGAPGTRTFSFEPVAAGETVLRLVKKRSWEATAAEEYTVILSVL